MPTVDQSQCQTQAPTMPFGKFKGTPLHELPADYLLWLGCLDDLRPPLLKHVLHEMGRRLVALDQPAEPALSADPIGAEGVR